MSPDLLRMLKRNGFGDAEHRQHADEDRGSGDSREAARSEHGRPAYKRIDTCAAEFESFTPYLYGSYDDECEAEPTPSRRS